ncbi:hypothetical protein PRIPAC_86357 [Pristionchus pacificus]|uniref:Uncharacterized protein n=1 Tax=Pristionchus pacificus TaxID=54126 RepID=A0A2A6BSP3_PRIPA|nr:hypothetical protein PRIPAC_86357 [Pristionchus pacificus]|eukprot:PDM68781.1 hypothetical protein PRIPAC_47083 [Pristionchus pacificus]
MNLPIVISTLENIKSHSFRESRFLSCAKLLQICPILRRSLAQSKKFNSLTQKSDYEKRRRDKLVELAKRAEQDQEKLLLQRTIAEQEAREIDKSLGMDEDFRKKSMAKMKGQIDVMGWRTNREVRDVRRELQEWKQKTSMADSERKKTMEQVEKNWADFGRLKTQSMALEVTQIKNRRGAAHLARMPKDVAEGTSKNLYKLCADLNRLTFHLNSKSPLISLVDEALVLAEAIAPLFGAKDEFVDSREATSTTNVSLSNVSITTSSGASAESSSTNSSAESSKSPSKKLTAPVRSSLRRVGKNPVAVSIPPLSKFVPNYSLREHLNFSLANWDIINSHIACHDWTIALLNKTATEAYSYFSNFVNGLLDAFVPLKVPKSSSGYPKFLSILHDRLERLHSAAPNCDSTHMLRARFNKALKTFEIKRESDAIHSGNANLFFKYCKTRFKPSSSSLPGIVDSSGTVLLTNKDKATAFSKFFSKVQTPPMIAALPLPPPPSTSFDIPFISFEQILLAISQLVPKSSTVIWNPTAIGLVNRLESVQREFTRRVLWRSRLPYLPYPQRLEHLQLETLEYRRALNDMYFLFDAVHGFVHLDTSNLYSIAPLSRSLRSSHNLRLAIPFLMPASFSSCASRELGMAANCEPTSIVPQAAPVEAPATPGPAPPMEPTAAPVAVPPSSAPVATPLPAPDAPLAAAPEVVSSPAPVAAPQLPVEAPVAAVVLTAAAPELPVEAPAEVAAAAAAHVAASPPPPAPAAAVPEQQPAAPTDAPAADVAPQPDAPSATSVSISDSERTDTQSPSFRVFFSSINAAKRYGILVKLRWSATDKALIMRTYADDLKLFAESPIHSDDLQSLSVVSSWSSHWNLGLSETKCTVLYYDSNNPRKQYHINGIPLAPPPDKKMFAKDLGVLFSPSLTFSDHITKAISKARSLTNLLFKSFRSISPIVYMKSFTTFILPHLEYGSIIWNPVHSVELTRSVEKVQQPSVTPHPFFAFPLSLVLFVIRTTYESHCHFLPPNSHTTVASRTICLWNSLPYTTVSSRSDSFCLFIASQPSSFSPVSIIELWLDL